jgi:hypothetical protein
MSFAQAALSAVTSNEQRPYVRFEYRPVEDRTVPSTDGVTHLKDMAWAVIRAPGSRDSVEKLAEDWLNGLPQLAKDGRIPPSWPSEYRNAFSEWVKTGETPVDGTAIRTWPPLRPAAREMLLSMGVVTVEQLASANEEIVNRLGMGGVSTRQMAQNWLKEAKTTGALAQELEAKTVRQSELESTVVALQAEVARLAALIPKPAK